jgi:uncharacterized protein (TIGR03067 family)
MIRWVGLITLALPVTFIAAQDNPRNKKKDVDPAVKEDKEKLQGKWMATAVEVGKVRNEISVGLAHITFTGDKFTQVDGERKRMGIFKLDPSRKPKAIDLIGGGGDTHGIYEVDEDKLRIGYPWVPMIRPKEFKGFFVIEYKRDVVKDKIGPENKKVFLPTCTPSSSPCAEARAPQM